VIALINSLIFLSKKDRAMPWKIEVELLFASPFLFMAIVFGIAETAQIFLAIREERRSHASEV
jgi:hypothetical protein